MSADKPTAVIVLAVIASASLGVAATLWVTRGSGPVAPSASPDAARASVPLAAAAASGQRAAPTRSETTGVFVNEIEISTAQLDALRQIYGAAPPRGQYWYDARSGLYGYWGYEAAGYIRPGHNFGPLSERASRGDTGIFLNGREINLAEALFFQQLFGVVYKGHFWLEGTTGDLGVDGSPIPVANLVAAMRAAQQRNQGGYHWRDGSGGVVSSESNCTFAAIPGAPVYSTPGCG